MPECLTQNYTGSIEFDANEGISLSPFITPSALSGYTAIQKARQTEPDQYSPDKFEISAPVDYFDIIQKSYTSAYHMACLDILASNTIGEITATDEELRWLEEAVSDEWDTFHEYAYSWWLDYYLAGVHYTEVEPSLKGVPARLHTTPLATWRIMRDKSAFRGMRFRQYSNTIKEFRAFGDKDAGGRSSILYVRKPNALSAWYGYPTWLPALECLRLDANMKLFLSSFFANGAIPALMILLQGGRFDPEAKKQILDGMRKIKGVKNANSTGILESTLEGAKIELKELTSPLKDFDFSKVSDPLRDEIIAAHRVAPRLMGVIAAGQLGGGNEGDSQTRAFFKTRIIPEQTKGSAIINRVLRAAGFPGTFKFSTPPEMYEPQTQAGSGQELFAAFGEAPGQLAKAETISPTLAKALLGGW